MSSKYSFINLNKRMINSVEYFFLAFSGGVDTLAIAHFLKRKGYNFSLLHVKHNCPEDGSAEIAEGAIKASKELEIPITISENLTVNYPVGASKESWCREIRYGILKQYGFVITGHHLNDLAEGYLQNCISGTPLRVPIQPVLYNGDYSVICRPFLRTRKVGFERYVDRHSLSHLIVPDPLSSQRKHIRDVVFPALGTDMTKVAERLFLKEY